MSHTPTLSDIASPNVDALASALTAHFPIFKKVITTRLEEFGASWLERFEHEMAASFSGDSDAIARAAKAYGAFSLEAMRLQAKFDLTLRYNASSYEEAVSEVYSNVEYMVTTYLPALLLSHYLWPHHYRQLHWAHDHFIDKLRNYDEVRFAMSASARVFIRKKSWRHCPMPRAGVLISVQHPSTTPSSCSPIGN